MSFPPVNLTSRQQKVLWATVRHYIATAEPVGSEALVKEYNLSVSSATIRNAMGVLEKAGLLYQPHTSAGRVPSDSGYRIYVDQLIQPSQALTTQAEQLLNHRLNAEDWSVEAVLRGAAQLLATVSGYIALVTLPQTTNTCLKHIQLVQAGGERVMLIFVTDTYETHSALMTLPTLADGETVNPDLLEQELQLLSNFLNSHLRGRSISELTSLDLGELDREFEHYANFLRDILAELGRRSSANAPTQLMISGLSEVLRQPEFAELQQIQTILHLLEDGQDQLLPIIFEQPDSEALGRRITIRIGAENPLEPMRACTLISSPYCKGSTPVGSVGVIGPTRMVYENAIVWVGAAADYLSDVMK